MILYSRLFAFLCNKVAGFAIIFVALKPPNLAVNLLPNLCQLLALEPLRIHKRCTAGPLFYFDLKNDFHGTS